VAADVWLGTGMAGDGANVRQCQAQRQG